MGWISLMDCVWKLSNVRAGFSEAEDRIDDVSFTINRGERVAFLGDDRSGRKQLLKVMCGLRPLRGGSMNVLGYESGAENYYRDWDDLLPRSIKSKLGVSLELDGLLSNVTIREGFELLFRFRYGDHSARLQQGAIKVVDQLCNEFDLASFMHKRPVQLSLSERKIASIARAFLARPRYMLLENPSEAVGQFSLVKLWSILGHVFENSERTVVLSTEDFRLAMKYCPRWIVFDQGRVVFDGLKEEFLKSQHPILKFLPPDGFTI